MRKVLKTKFYSFLATRWGVAIFVIGLFLSFNSLLQLLTAILDEEIVIPVPPMTRSGVLTNSAFTAELFENVDVVFTWVNGTDPRHIAALRDTKYQLLGEIVKVCNSTEIPDVDNCTRDEETSSRFKDNEELRYSLRSIEKYAPWINHIYLVTNGQVPYWINTSHPRLSIITHEQIFANHSHLPTFSSPAIEANLHRIPGLSPRFIYFNDDTMLGTKVYPDDFETKSSGQKVFLAWAVPNCAEGCPSSWIGDGFCDQACNCSSCDWDGGDCANITTASNSYVTNNNNNYGNNNSGGTKATSYCASGCPDSWIGDKFCDRTCRVADCAFDAGDCEATEMTDQVWHVMLNESMDVITLPHGIPAAYFNLTELVGTGRISDGSHDNALMIRSATISQKYKIITFTFHKEITEQIVSVHLEIDKDGSKNSVKFNISHCTSTVPVESENNTLTDTSSDVVNPTSVVDTVSMVDDQVPAPVEAPLSLDKRRVPLEFEELPYSMTKDSGRNATEELIVSLMETFKFNRTFVQAILVRAKERFGLNFEDEESWIDRAKEKLKQLREFSARPASIRDSPWIEEGPLDEEEFAWPWERQDVDDIVDEVMSSNTGRKLKDMYGDSLKYVNSLMNAAFGSTARKVPAHMPHYMNLQILKDLHEFWPDKWNATSSHQLRSSSDMQFAFSYFYFMIHQLNRFNFTETWQEFLDTDLDGRLSTNEIRTLAAHIETLPLENNVLEELHAQLMNCSDGGLITKNVVKNCTTIYKKIREHFSIKPKNRHEILDTEDVAFLMIGMNATNVQKSLDGIRERRQKFICLNDNINHSDPRAEQVLDIIKQFYDSLFPLKSTFEFPSGVENEFLHLDEFPEPYIAPKDLASREKTYSVSKHYVIYFVLSAFVFTSCFVFWRIRRAGTGTTEEQEARKRREKRFLVMLNTA